MNTHSAKNANKLTSFGCCRSVTEYVPDHPTSQGVGEEILRIVLVFRESSKAIIGAIHELTAILYSAECVRLPRNYYTGDEVKQGIFRVFGKMLVVKLRNATKMAPTVRMKSQWAGSTA
jgi:hypothetical protein